MSYIFTNKVVREELGKLLLATIDDDTQSTDLSLTLNTLKDISLLIEKGDKVIVIADMNIKVDYKDFIINSLSEYGYTLNKPLSNLDDYQYVFILEDASAKYLGDIGRVFTNVSWMAQNLYKQGKISEPCNADLSELVSYNLKDFQQKDTQLMEQGKDDFYENMENYFTPLLLNSFKKVV